jgi:hypothetical protein
MGPGAGAGVGPGSVGHRHALVPQSQQAIGAGLPGHSWPDVGSQHAPIFRKEEAVIIAKKPTEHEKVQN